jgi:drug/metabolite transporter (DMT)-like permease
MATPTQRRGLWLTLAAASCYGFSIAFTRLASFAGITGTTLVFYRVVLMLALVSAVAFVLRRSLAVPRGERGTILLLALATATLGIAYLTSVAYVPVTVAVVIFYTYPALIVLASPIVEGRRLTAGLVGVLALALTGVVLVVGPAFNGLDPRGLALAFLASVATATQFLAAARAPRTGLVAKVFWVHVVVVPVSGLLGLLVAGLNPPDEVLAALVPVALTIAGYVIGFGLQIAALARSSAVAAGLAFCAEPVVAALSSAVVLGERLDAVQACGGALVLAAIAASIMLDERPASRSARATEAP